MSIETKAMRHRPLPAPRRRWRGQNWPERALQGVIGLSLGLAAGCVVALAWAALMAAVGGAR